MTRSPDAAVTPVKPADNIVAGAVERPGGNDPGAMPVGGGGGKSAVRKVGRTQPLRIKKKGLHILVESESLP